MVFRNGSLEMTVDEFTVMQIRDNLERKRKVAETSTCDLLVQMKNSNSTIVEEIKGFEYSGDSWEDEDIESFIVQHLKD